MKYMTFNSSCSFAGVANMLLQFGIDVEDRQIALGMNLPYLFDLRDGVYLSGPMLQTADRFNLYLHTLGYAMTEHAVNRSEVADYLRQCGVAMLGLRVSPKEKHAVVFVGTEGESLRLINNKRQGSEEPETICLSKEELEERLDDIAMVATIGEAPVSVPNFDPLFLRSCQVLEQYKADVRHFCGTQKTKEERLAAMDPLFRATLLDGITMLELIGQDALAEQFRQIRQSFLRAVKEEPPVVLCEKLDMKMWLAAIDEYIAVIKNRALHAEKHVKKSHTV